MYGLIQGMFDNPLYGILTLIVCAILHLWKEQSKIKDDNRKDVETLHEKKLGKEEFTHYHETHNEVHAGTRDQLKLIAELLAKGRR